MDIDLIILQNVNQLALRWLWLDTLAIFFAQYSEYILIFCFLLFLLKDFKKYRLMIIQGFLSAVFSRFVIVNFIRWLWPRPRPFVENHINLLLDTIKAASFPSGHAAFYSGLSTIIYFYNKKAGVSFFLASFLISISRVFCGLHWLSDILSGLLVGIFSGWLITFLFRKFLSLKKKELPH